MTHATYAPPHAWWPVALSTDLPHSLRKPLARQLLGLPYVLLRDAQGRPAVLLDRCPHRHAPLSDGCIDNASLICPYHGWRFDAQGRCIEVPGRVAQGARSAASSSPHADQQTLQADGSPKPLLSANAIVPSLRTWEQDGVIWAYVGDDAPGLAPDHLPPQAAPFGDHDALTMQGVTDGSLVDVLENFLDACHTPYVHNGWLRHQNRRSLLRATVHPLADGIEAQYHDEPGQTGLVPRLLERGRTLSLGRFRLPGMAELEYHDRHGKQLQISVWLAPEHEHRCRYYALVLMRRAGALPAAGPSGASAQASSLVASVASSLAAPLRRAIVRSLFSVLIRQDRRIVQAVTAHRLKHHAQWPDQRVLNTELDLLGPTIRAMLAGAPRPPLPADAVMMRL